MVPCWLLRLVTLGDNTEGVVLDLVILMNARVV